MKIFVAFGYNERDCWVKKLVFPLVESFGHRPENGEDLAGRPLEEGVSARIARCHAMVGFATRRGEPANGVWATHRWVQDELAYAVAKKLLVVEVRETGVDPQGGLLGARQHLTYDEGQRELFLVDLAKVLGAWPRGRVRLQLLGDGRESQIVPLLRRPNFHCVYRFHQNGEELPEVETRIVPITGGLFVDVENVPPDALIQVELRYDNRIWSSGFESLDSHNVRLFEG